MLVQLLRVVWSPFGGLGGLDWVGMHAVGVRGFVGTLLGPETTSPAFHVMVWSSPFAVGVGWWCGGWVFGVSAWPCMLVYRSALLTSVGAVDVGAGGCVWCGFVV